MKQWNRFDEIEPDDYEFIVAIRRMDEYDDVSEWESDLGWNAVGHWHNGEVWEGGNDLNGFTHWIALPTCKSGKLVEEE